MSHLEIDRKPDLHDPIGVVAFAGWNDAASSATNTARFIVRRLGARRFASINPEDFYNFTDSRPNARLNAAQQREIIWPANEFFYARNPVGPHDVVVLIGVEPNLRWRTFNEAAAGLMQDLGVGMVVSLGALMANVPHTRDVRVTGTAIDADVARSLDLSTSKYEGPTGIVGVMHDSLRKAGIAAASLWANVPHYITTAQNPPATLALLKRLQSVLGMEFDSTELQAAGERFVNEVNTAVSGNPEIMEYVHRMEALIDAGADIPTEENPTGLPPSEDLVTDIEEFLRGQRDDS